MPRLVPVVKILKKIGVTGKIWKRAGAKLLRDLTEKSVNFGTLVTSNIRPLLFFVEEDQKKILITEEKLGTITAFSRSNLPS